MIVLLQECLYLLLSEATVEGVELYSTRGKVAHSYLRGLELGCLDDLVDESMAVYREAMTIIGEGDVERGVQRGPVVAVGTGAISSPVV